MGETKREVNRRGFRVVWLCAALCGLIAVYGYELRFLSSKTPVVVVVYFF